MPRSRRPIALLAVVVMLVTAIPATTAAADPPTVRTYSPIDRGEYVRSVYDDGVFLEHEPSIEYFVTGRGGHTPHTTLLSNEFRSFFVFDVEPTDRPITKTVLRIVVPANGYASDDPSETFALVDVTSSISTLRAGGTGWAPTSLEAIFDDLGDGHQYASRTFTKADDGKTVDIELDAVARAMLKTGGTVAFGGHLTTGSTASNKWEYLFELSGLTPVRLQVTIAPPPPGPGPSKLDASIRNGATAVAGTGVINATGKDQKLTRSVKKGKSTTYRITITNTGSNQDAYVVKAAKGTSAYQVVYKKGSKVITSAVAANGGYTTPKIKPGKSLDLTMVVTVKSGAAKGSRVTRPVTVAVKGKASIKDVVVAIVKRKS